MTAKFICELSVIDPDSNAEVHICVFKEDAGGMFAVDSSFINELDEDETVISPFGNGDVELIGV